MSDIDEAFDKAETPLEIAESIPLPDMPVVEPSRITVGDTVTDVRRRNIVVFQPLREHPGHKAYDIGLMLEADMREAMALAARRLDNEASKYRVTGYTWDLEDIQYDIAKPRLLMATLVVSRG